MLTELKKFFLSTIKKAKCIDEAISICVFFEDIVNVNFINIYFFDEIEEIVFNKFLKNIPFPLISCPNHKRVLHIISEGYKTGGHTRLMERLALMHNVKPDLLVSKKDDVDHSDIFNKIYTNQDNNILNSIFYFYSIISNYNIIVLHINPDDILVSLVLRKIKENYPEKKIYFVNHADHQFSYGRGISDVILEIGAFGPFLQKKMDFLGNSSFLGIPVVFSEKNRNEFNVNSSEILTAGSSWKYKPIGNFSFQNKIFNIMNLNKEIKFTVIGVNFIKDYWWWPLKLKHPKRLKLIKSLPYEEYLKIFRLNYVYCDSYPIPGGTAFVEAMQRSSLVIGFDTVVSGATPLDKIRIKNEDEFLDVLNNPFSQIKKNELLISELHEFHDLSSVRKRYLDALNGVFSNCNLAINDYANYYPSLKFKKSLFSINWNLDKKYLDKKIILKFIMNYFFYVSPKIYVKFVMNLLINIISRRI